MNVLLYYLHENDVENKKNNVIICLNSDDSNIEVQILDNALENLEEINPVLNPFVIYIGNYEINEEFKTDKLKFKNYIPKYEKFQNYRQIQLSRNENENDELAFKTFKSFLLSKLTRIDQYYNERGFNYNFINPLETKNIGAHLTIALAGFSGLGKSTFIDLNFGQLVAKISKSTTDSTTKAAEYYLPIQNTENNFDNVGQIRFIDFPGLNQEGNYEIVKREIRNKISKFKEQKESIDIALIFLRNDNGRLDNRISRLIDLFWENKIQMLFVVNGIMDPVDYNEMVRRLKNILNDIPNNKIIINDYNNINTNFRYNRNVNHISEIWNKILGLVKIREDICEDIRQNLTLENFNEKYQDLVRNSIFFKKYPDFRMLQQSIYAMAVLTATSFCAFTAGTSFLSLVVPLVDSVLAIGYNVAMIFSILSLYEINKDDYDIVQMILSSGEKIVRLNKNPTNNDENRNQIQNQNNNEINSENSAKDIAKEIVHQTTDGAIFAGQIGVKKIAQNAGNVVLEKTIETTVKETTMIGYQISSGNIIQGAAAVVTKSATSKTVETITVESGKEASKLIGKTVSKAIVEEATEAGIIMGIKEGGEEVVIGATKQTVKTVTEEVVVKQGGQCWIASIGEFTPFIGVVVSLAMNCYSSIKTSKNVINYFEEDFENSKVVFIKNRINTYENINEQIETLIRKFQNNNLIL